ncbi:MAG: RIP metalloprotease RseP [Parcubacteria bacterium C7867-006]|nr:MAG: RIP metalloprotease RseP [Parcubacteria bacterium C7867-006]
MSILVFLIILALLILVHEFGHFIVAKKSGIRVDEFGLGFPPKIYSKQWGSTLYTLNAIPFGGFVKIFGEDPHSENISEEDRPTSFYYKPKWIQSMVLVAGVTFNILFAWFLISLGYGIGIPSPVDHSGFGEVKNPHLVITEVMQDSPAQKAGLKSGDYITSLSSGASNLKDKDLTPENIQNVISETKTEVKVNYVRGSDPEKSVSVTPSNSLSGGKKVIGIAMDEIGTLKLPIHLAVLEGAKTTYLLTKATAVGLFSFLRDVVLFRSDFSQVSGPIGIAGVVGEATKLGFTYIISLTALISINLAIINLLPFPALDGGRLLFVIIESVKRKPISPRFVRNANFIGFAILIILMVVVSTHDILKLF